MRKVILILLSILCCSLLSGQGYYVYSVTGTAEIQSGNKWIPLVRGNSLKDSDFIRTAENSSVSILDRENNNLIAFSNTKKSSVKSIISSKKKNSYLKEVISYLWLALNDKIEKKTESAGVVYKGEYNLTKIMTESQMYYSVTLALTDRNGTPLTGPLKVGTEVFVKITNPTETDLFVDVLDIDSEKTITEIFGIETPADMAEFLIPAKSTILLSGFPLTISPPTGTDYLMPVAYPKPFVIGLHTDAIVFTGIPERALRVETVE